ncbi:MAG: hypothetical protein AB8H47_30150 [Bacteroidia bacterium]
MDSELQAWELDPLHGKADSIELALFYGVYFTERSFQAFREA